MKKELITTKINLSRSKKHIYLGNWCNNDDKIIPYHWSRIKKIEKDYKYLNRLNKKFLKLISKKLNDFHQVNKSNKYWNIILGPWLNITLTTYFDKWCNIESVNKSNYFSKEYYVEKNKLIPIDFEDFLENLNSDVWNHYIYNTILKFRNYDVRKSKKKLNLIKKTNYVESTNIKQKLINFYAKFSQHLDKLFPKTKYVFFETGNIKKEFFYQIKLRQIPRLYKFDLNLIKKIDFKKRETLIFRNNQIKNFENFLLNHLMFLIPSSYLENYKHIENYYSSKFIKKKGCIISTSNAHYNNDNFKIWLANQIEKDSKLVLFQHGGTIGIAKFYWPQKHSLEISNYFISFGWKNNNSKIKPLGNIFLYDKIKNKIKKKNKLLIVFTTEIRYSSYIGAKPISSGMLKELKKNISLIKNLNDNVVNNTIIRLHHKDYGWKWKSRIQKEIKNIQFSNTSTKITKYYSESKIVVHCYNATSFLETINLNIPTIIYLDKNSNLLNSKSIKIFKLLKSVGIFHDNFKSASKQINHVWNNVENWWSSHSTQKALNEFKKIYVSPFENNTKQITNFFSNLQKFD